MMLDILLTLITIFGVQGDNKVYYIAAVEAMWDYAPTGRNIVTDDLSISEQYLNQSYIRLGHVYKKAMFREYTDNTYTVQKDRPSYLGYLGPTLTANVDDTLIIHFKNEANRPFSVHPLAFNVINTDVDSEANNAVDPGETQEYHWRVGKSSGPREDDPECVTSLYYSNTDMIKDVNSGLVGLVVICRKGTRSDVQQKHFVIYLNTADENRSWYFDDIIQQHVDRNEYSCLSDLKNNSDFIESNRMHSINGYVYGNIPPLSVCVNDEVRIHLAALGDSDDVHAFRVYGHSVVQRNQRTDAVQIYPGVTVTAIFNATEIGTWMLGSQSEHHWKGGMLGKIVVRECGRQRQRIHMSGTIRRYYIATERLNSDEVDGSRMIFQQYTYGSFVNRKERMSTTSHLLNLGPLITAEVGDLIKVIFYNKGSKPYSIYPRGLRMSKLNEGVFYKDGQPDKTAVLPNRIKTYYWTIPESFSPRAGDPTCLTRFYASEAEEFDGARSGLIGPMLICKEDTLNGLGYPDYTAKDLFLFFMENNASTDGPTYTINGKATPLTIDVCVNHLMNLHLLYYGTAQSSITILFRGNPVTHTGSVKTSIGVLFNFPVTVQLVPKRKGVISIDKSETVLYYNTSPCEGSDEEGDTITYTMGQTLNIAVDEGNWDYSRGLRSQDEWTSLYPGSIGPVYKKASYKKYITTYFFYSHQDTTSNIVVNVGQKIRIEFKNRASHPFSMHADGVIIEVEGRENNDTIVNPNERRTFIWKFPPESGPGDNDPQCIMRPYYSNVNKQRDMASGLIGPLIICRESTDKPHYVLFVGETDETQSWYIEENLQGKNVQKTDLNYISGNTIYAINRFADGTYPDMSRISPGTEIFLHIANIGNKFHSVYLEGNYFNISASTNVGPNVLGLHPGTSSTVMVTMENEGLWTIKGLGTEDQVAHLYGSCNVGSTVVNPSK